MTNSIQNRLTIKHDERVFICGRTGSGKTFLAKHLISRYSRVIVVDPKGTFHADGLENWNRSSRKKIFNDDKPFKIRIPPLIADNQEEAYDEYFSELYEADNYLIYIDELYGVVTGVKGGKWLRALYTQGREFGISVIASTQRPAWIPTFTMSEAEWFFCFQLQMLKDRMTMAENGMGKAVQTKIPHEHGFYYYHNKTMQEPVYVSQLTIRKAN